MPIILMLRKPRPKRLTNQDRIANDQSKIGSVKASISKSKVEKQMGKEP